MAERKHVQHVKSTVPGKLPDQDVLLPGEIAVNYAAGQEMLSVQNTDGEVVSFPSVIEMQVISASLNDLEARKANINDLEDTFLTESEARSIFATKEDAGKVEVDETMSGTSTNPVQNKVVYSALSEKVDKVDGKVLSSNDYTAAEKTKLAGIAEGANKVEVDETNGSIKINGTTTGVYTLPKATNSVLGGVTVGENVSVSDGEISVPTNDMEEANSESDMPASIGSVYTETKNNEETVSASLNDLNARIKSLEAENEELYDAISALERRIEALEQ